MRMIKKDLLKSVFEHEVSFQRRKNFWGHSVRVIYDIRIANALQNTFVSLIARELGTNVERCIVRSYPMSYKSAYRLVCSL